LNLESIQKKMKNHFGHKCDFLAIRLYYFLSDNVNLKRIYLKDFIEKMLVFWEGSYREIMRVCFRMIDLDHDQVLNGIDLLTIQNSIDLESEFGQEVLILVDHYITTHLMTRQRVNPKHYLHLDNYIKLLNDQYSCLVAEIKTKVLQKPGKLAHKSAMIKEEVVQDQSGTYGERATGRRAVAPKRAILQPIGGKDKVIKRVTFAYLPPMKDEGERKQLPVDHMPPP